MSEMQLEQLATLLEQLSSAIFWETLARHWRQCEDHRAHADRFRHAGDQKAARDEKTLAETFRQSALDLTERLAEAHRLARFVAPEILRWLPWSSSETSPQAGADRCRKALSVVMCRLRRQELAQSPETPAPPEDEFVFRGDGDGWFVRGFGAEGHFKDIVGFRYIARLLAAPNGAVPMVELVAEADNAANRPISPAGGDIVADKQALEECRDRLCDIESEIEAARRNNDLGCLDGLEVDKQKLIDHLCKATGLGGRTRKLGDDLNRLRARVAGALGRAYNTLEKAGLKAVATHFRNSVTAEGAVYLYQPADRPAWNLEENAEKAGQ